MLEVYKDTPKKDHPPAPPQFIETALWHQIPICRTGLGRSGLGAWCPGGLKVKEHGFCHCLVGKAAFPSDSRGLCKEFDSSLFFGSAGSPLLQECGWRLWHDWLYIDVLSQQELIWHAIWTAS